MQIKDGHQWKAIFITHKGLFEPTVMFFGLTNSPATFQRFMNDSFCNMITEGWLIIYMDDLLIYSIPLIPPFTRSALNKSYNAWPTLTSISSLRSAHLPLDKVEYLGMIVKLGQLAMDPVKPEGIASWPTPTKVKDV